MLSYYDLSIPVQSLLILGLFLELCAGGCLLSCASGSCTPN